MDLDLGDLRLRTLTAEDAPLLVEATRAEPGRALWGPHPSGPYSLEDARCAMREWDPRAGGQVSVGVLRDGRLLGALGVMPDAPGSAELAYWVRPEERRRGIALRCLEALTGWAHTSGGLPRVWLEIDPDPEHASEIEVRFAADGPGQTTVELEHRHLERLVDGKAIHDAIVVGGGGWNSLLELFAKAATNQR